MLGQRADVHIYCNLGYDHDQVVSCQAQLAHICDSRLTSSTLDSLLPVVVGTNKSHSYYTRDSAVLYLSRVHIRKYIFYSCLTTIGALASRECCSTGEKKKKKKNVGDSRWKI